MWPFKKTTYNRSEFYGPRSPLNRPRVPSDSSPFPSFSSSYSYTWVENDSRDADQDGVINDYERGVTDARAGKAALAGQSTDYYIGHSDGEGDLALEEGGIS